MNSFAKWLALISALAAVTASDAFLSASLTRSAALRQSSSDEGDGSTTINIALIDTTTSSDENERLTATLREHPFCKMTGVKLSIDEVPTSASSDGWGKEHVNTLQHADIACFATKASVISYLTQLDKYLGAEDASDEDRRKLPNKPDLMGDIIGSAAGTAPTAETTLMAACPSTGAAKECLNSGRWMSNHIYYPKDTQQAVELKTQAIGEGGEEEDEEAEGGIDLNVWADSVMQAAGDVLERKFWGGGW